MPDLLNKAYKDQLVTWIGKSCHFRLLYKISRDGCSAQTFHQKCDGQGPTVTVLYNTSKTIFGGYLSQSWNSNGGYINDNRAFVFRMQYNGSSSPKKFPIIQAELDRMNKSRHKISVKKERKCYAGFGSIDCGPSFGNGDIKTFSGQIKRTRNYFDLNGSVSCLGDSYTLHGENSNSITNDNLQVSDLEVYRVVDGDAPQSILEKPWREYTDWTEEKMKEMKENLLAYKPVAEANVQAANILLLGPIGSGKSSFFNSINSIFSKRITSKACSGSFEHCVTTMYRQYKIKDRSSRKYLNFRLCDSRGFEEDFAMDTQEMSFILDGNIPDRYQFNPMVPFTSDNPKFINNPNLNNKIHCVAFVIDSSSVEVMSDSVLEKMKDLQVRMNQRGIPQIVLLAKIDKICLDVNDDVTSTFTSSAVCEALEKVADIMGLPRAHVLPVKNYESETKLKTGVNILLMEALERCLDFADDFMDDQLHTWASEGKDIES
ncbi:interferon-induced protein 44-like [Crassostrea virginica]